MRWIKTFEEADNKLWWLYDKNIVSAEYKETVSFTEEELDVVSRYMQFRSTKLYIRDLEEALYIFRKSVGFIVVKLEDGWFYIYHNFNYFICDGFDGLIEFIKNFIKKYETYFIREAFPSITPSHIKTFESFDFNGKLYKKVNTELRGILKKGFVDFSDSDFVKLKKLFLSQYWEFENVHPIGDNVKIYIGGTEFEIKSIYDSWFLIIESVINDFDDYTIDYFYCDDIDGVVECLKENIDFQNLTLKKRNLKNRFLF